MRLNPDGSLLIPAEVVARHGIRPPMTVDVVEASSDGELVLKAGVSAAGETYEEIAARVDKAYGSIKPVIPFDEYFRWTRGTDEPL